MKHHRFIYHCLINKTRRYIKLYRIFGWGFTFREVCLSLIRKIFVFRIIEFYELTNDSYSDVSVKGNFTFGFAHLQKINGMILQEQNLSQGEVASNLRSGKRCFGGWYKEEMVGMRWVDKNRFVLPGCFVLELPSNCASVGGAFTAAKWRGQGISPTILSKLYSDLLHGGIDCLFLYIEFENLSSFRGVSKVGFKKVGTYMLFGTYNKCLRKIKIKNSRLRNIMIEQGLIKK